jgi:hypothetical protein
MANRAADLITTLNAGTFWMNHIIPVLQIAFGAFGNIFNILVFTRPSLHTSPCSMYFLLSMCPYLHVVCHTTMECISIEYERCFL